MIAVRVFEKAVEPLLTKFQQTKFLYYQKALQHCTFCDVTESIYPCGGRNDIKFINQILDMDCGNDVDGHFAGRSSCCGVPHCIHVPVFIFYFNVPIFLSAVEANNVRFLVDCDRLLHARPHHHLHVPVQGFRCVLGEVSARIEKC
ncbi:hypothetical protein AVEN_211410-1, partial [Araneus ventricosus]